VTEDGFRLITLPNETYSWLRDWYIKAKQERMEDEGSSGSCMNQAVAPSSVTHITPAEKKRLAVELQVIFILNYRSIVASIPFVFTDTCYLVCSQYSRDGMEESYI
jgi:hypothetical protein